MTPHDLLAHFETLAEAPNGIQRLRELVLELAVRGKLVEQDPAEGRAQDQFPNLCSGKVGTDVPKRGRQLKGPDAPEPAPNDLPNNSIWVPIGHLMDLFNGRAFKPNEWATTGLPIIRIQNLNDPSAPFNFCNFEVPEKVHVHDGDLLISWSGTPGTSFGAFIWGRGHAVLNQHIFRVELRHPGLVPEYIRLSVNARLDEMISRAHGGVGLRHITKGELEAIGIPIPPEAEQHRIVARVAELMALLDRLETKRQECETARTAARDSALAALREAPTPDDVETAWLRIQERSRDLFITSTDLEPLRATILGLAIKGLLLPQNPKDEHADDVLAAIAAEVHGRNPKTGARGHVASHLAERVSLPFPLPLNWKGVEAETLCRPSNAITYGVLKPEWVPEGVPTVRVQDMQNGEILVANVGQCSIERAAKFSKTKLVTGDLLIAKDGATLGKTAFVPEALEGGNITQHVLRFSITRHVLSLYIRLVIDSPHGQAWMRDETKGVALPGVNVGDFRRMPIPIPPLEEQRRIVGKVDQLLALTSALANKLASTIDIQNAFASATVHYLDI